MLFISVALNRRVLFVMDEDNPTPHHSQLAVRVCFQGRQFDSNGELLDWWEPATKRQFLKGAECMIYQYGNYTVPEVDMKVRKARNSLCRLAIAVFANITRAVCAVFLPLMCFPLTARQRRVYDCSSV